MSLDSTIRHLKARHVGRGEVLAVGRGRKWTKGARTQETGIVFYVRRKRARSKLGSRCIPRRVYDRRPDGSLDRSRHYRTDVQVVGTPRFSVAGDKIRRPPVRFGSATLSFDVRRPGAQRRVYVVSASHVIGNVFGGSYPSDPRVEMNQSTSSRVEGRTVTHVWRRQGQLRFDVAMARLTRGYAKLPLRQVPRDSHALDRLAPAPREGKRLSIVGARFSGVKRGRVRGKLDSPMPILYRRGSQRVSVPVANLYDLEGFRPKEGDSGGLVYSGSGAVGIIVAQHAGGCFFQPLRRALAYLLERTSEDIEMDDIF